MEPVTVVLAAIALLLDKEPRVPSAAAVERRSLQKPSQRVIMSVDVGMTALVPLKEKLASVALRQFNPMIELNGCN